MQVTLERVSKRFDGQTVVDDVSLAVGDGELFFLLGPSGCGKTTLLRCIAGFYVPDAGRIWIGEQDATRLPPHRRDTGMVFQSYALWPHLSVAENVAFGLRIRKRPAAEIRERVAAALALVHMSERAGQRPSQLSGGQQQRVALARALVIRPRCLLLDEPLSNLDAKLRWEMRGEIRRICKESGLTAIYVTHDQKEALSIADRIAVLQQGRVVQCAPPQEMYRQPANRFVAGFLGETNLLSGTVAECADGQSRVRTAAGVLTAAGDAGPAGRGVTLSVRPEAVRLGPAPAGQPNAFTASLADTVYLGEMAQRELRVGQAALKAYEINPRPAAAGAAVDLWIDPADIVLLAD